jgi:hypothetical protein
MRICDFLERKLMLLNKTTKVTVNNSSGAARVKAAMERHNNNINSQLGFDGVELSKEELAQMKIAIPAAFKDKPVMYEATASHFFGDGKLAGQTHFGIEVIL